MYMEYLLLFYVCFVEIHKITAKMEREFFAFFHETTWTILGISAIVITGGGGKSDIG